MAVGLFQHADVDMAELLRDQGQRRAVHGRQGGPRVTQCVGKLTQGLMSARWHVCAIREELMRCPPRLAAWRCSTGNLKHVNPCAWGGGSWHFQAPRLAAGRAY